MSSEIWLYVGSFSGSLIAMLVARRLHLMERLGGLVVGSLAGAFFGPAICEIWFAQYDPATSKIPASVCCFVGIIAVGVVPTLIERAKKAFSQWNFKIEKAND